VKGCVVLVLMERLISVNVLLVLLPISQPQNTGVRSLSGALDKTCHDKIHSEKVRSPACDSIASGSGFLSRRRHL